MHNCTCFSVTVHLLYIKIDCIAAEHVSEGSLFSVPLCSFQEGQSESILITQQQGVTVQNNFHNFIITYNKSTVPMYRTVKQCTTFVGIFYFVRCKKF
jgi:hypothetical protein